MSLTSPGAAFRDRQLLEEEYVELLDLVYGLFALEVLRQATEDLEITTETLTSASGPKPPIRPRYGLGGQFGVTDNPFFMRDRRNPRREPFSYTRIKESWSAGINKILREAEFSGMSLPSRVRDRLNYHGLAETMATEASEMLALSREEGWSKAKTKRALFGLLTPSPGSDSHETYKARVRRLGRSWATGNYNALQLNELIAYGVAKKKWVARMDNRTRHSHMAANGMVVDVDEMFLVGDEYLAFPGDPNGSEKETANCRCVLIGEGESTRESPKGDWFDERKYARMRQGFREVLETAGPEGQSAWDAIDAYASKTNFRRVQEAARGASDDPVGLQFVREIDRALRDHGVEIEHGGAILWRGGRMTETPRVGGIIKPRGFVSASSDIDTASMFAEASTAEGQSVDDKWLITIDVPAGKKYVPGYAPEYELIFPRNTMLRIRSVNPRQRRVEAVME